MGHEQTPFQIRRLRSVARSASTPRISKPWWPANIVQPKGAPNILLIMTDDQGCGVPGTFGGVIPTPIGEAAGKRARAYERSARTGGLRRVRGNSHHTSRKVLDDGTSSARLFRELDAGIIPSA